jgi:hypothetical protein
MRTRHVLAAVALFGVINCRAARPQTPPQLARDTAKPFVYIEFDHAGPRQPLEDGEPPRGLWLRLVNNSVFPILVRVHGSLTDPEMTILEDVVTPQIRRMPKSGPRDYGPMPNGYASAVDAASRQTIAPGKEVLFSVPVNHVAPGWFLQVSFQFDLSPAKDGAAQPVCYAAFAWDGIPEKLREQTGTPTMR